jgi:hypothetical protein
VVMVHFFLSISYRRWNHRTAKKGYLWWFIFSFQPAREGGTMGEEAGCGSGYWLHLFLFCQFIEVANNVIVQ